MAISGIAGSGGPEVVSGASPAAAPATKMSDLFNTIDTTGAGSINQTQFNHAFNTLNPPGVFRAAGADAIFNQLDPSGAGSVSKSNFVQTMSGLMRTLRGAAASGTSPATVTTTSPASSLASSLQSFNQLNDTSDAAASNGLGGAFDVLA
jgi:hypothetical protein